MKQNRFYVWMAALVLLTSSCNTTEQGAYNGAMFGSMIGSAIGGLAGGWRGSDIGQLAGLAGGAIAGAAIGKANEDSHRDVVIGRHIEKVKHQQEQESYELQDGYDPQGRGDDRITLDGGRDAIVNLEVRHLCVFDTTRDGVLTRGEEGRVVFEIYNPTSTPAYRIHPVVSEVTGNKHIRISENVYVESIQPHQGIRYTAMLKADNSLKDGEAVIRVAVRQAGRELKSQTQELTLRTSKR